MSCSTSRISAPQLLIKQPLEELIFTMDFTERVPTGVTITSADATSYYLAEETGDLEIDNIQITGKKILMLISGGLHAHSYAVEVTCELSNNEVIIGRGMLNVRTS